MPRKDQTHKVETGNYYYVSATGSRTNQGTQDSPWSLAHAMKHIQPGDTVLLSGGTYQTGINITASGTADHKLTFKPVPGETVILDGSIPEFTIIGNSAWVPDQELGPNHNVYRSAKCYPIKGAYGGFIEINGEWYSLAPHKLYTFLFSDLHEWDEKQPRYLGPGITQDKTGKGCPPDHGYLYIRLDNSEPKAQLDRPVPQISDPDPRHHSIYIGDVDTPGIKISGSHLVIEDFTEINNFGSCITMNARRQTDVTLRNCGGRPLYFGMRCGYVDYLLLDSCKFYAHMPGDKWWVSLADIKAARDEEGKIPEGVPPADHVRKVGLGLGVASHVRVVDCLFDEFFDGILATAPPDILTLPAHNVDVQRTIFNNIWDDAWQMTGYLYQIEFHHNFCFGAGPSVDGAGTSEANKEPGTIYIHHNVIDTTKKLVFWGRCNAPIEGMFESIPLSSHKNDPHETNKYTLPRKIYYNTIVTGKIYNRAHPYVGWSFFGSRDRKLTSLEKHEVYNNIFLVLDGRPGGRDFDASSGWEIYDGNVYWQYSEDSPSDVKSPWQLVWISAEGDAIRNALTVDNLRSFTYKVSHSYYLPGWEKSGLSKDPMLDPSYKAQARYCWTGAVNLKRRGWPGTSSYQPSRGAVAVGYPRRTR